MNSEAETCSRAAEIVRERGSIELCEEDGRPRCAIFGPELADVLDAAAGRAEGLATQLQDHVQALARVIMFAAEESS